MFTRITITTANNLIVFDESISVNYVHKIYNAGLYEYSYKSTINETIQAKNFIEPLMEGYRLFENKRLGYPPKDNSNDKLAYVFLSNFIKSYLLACIAHPEAIINIET